MTRWTLAMSVSGMLSLCAAASGCSRYYGLQHVVHLQAQHHFACDEEGTVVRALNKNTFRAQGCGREALYQCHRWDKNCQNLNRVAQRRAVTEFSCPADQVGVVLLSPYVMKISACGHQAVYRCEMRGGVASCVREGGPVEPPAGAPPGSQAAPPPASPQAEPPTAPQAEPPAAPQTMPATAPQAAPPTAP